MARGGGGFQVGRAPLSPPSLNKSNPTFHAWTVLNLISGNYFFNNLRLCGFPNSLPPPPFPPLPFTDPSEQKHQTPFHSGLLLPLGYLERELRRCKNNLYPAFLFLSPVLFLLCKQRGNKIRLFFPSLGSERRGMGRGMLCEEIGLAWAR